VDDPLTKLAVLSVIALFCSGCYKRPLDRFFERFRRTTLWVTFMSLGLISVVLGEAFKPLVPFSIIGCCVALVIAFHGLEFDR
jgi:hypothetical protein